MKTIFLLCLFSINSAFAFQQIYENLDKASENLNRDYDKLPAENIAEVDQIAIQMEELSARLVELSTYVEQSHMAKVTVGKKNYLIEFKNTDDFASQCEQQVDVHNWGEELVMVQFNSQSKKMKTVSPNPLYRDKAVICKVAQALMTEIAPKIMFPEFDNIIVGWFHYQPLIAVGETHQEKMNFCENFVHVKERFPFHKMMVKYADEVGGKYRMKDNSNGNSWYDAQAVCREAMTLMF